MVYRCFGAIVGDTIGSRFEFNNYKYKDFRLFTKESRPTDDSYLTIAVMSALETYIETGDLKLYKEQLIDTFKFFVKVYPKGGYGGRFRKWCMGTSREPYNSLGNGAAMRVSPCAYVGRTLEEVKALTKVTTEVTHNHPEALEWADRLTTIIYMLRTKTWGKGAFKAYVQNNFPDECVFELDEIRPYHFFNESCVGTVPVSVACVLESEDFEDTIRNAIAMGGDSDTIAAIAGSIAEPLYGIPFTLFQETLVRLPEELRRVTEKFSEFVKTHR